MDFNKKQAALLYLDKNGFYFYTDGLPSVISLAFIDNAVRDMDVVNGASLIAQVKAFIDQYRLMPSMITIILSPNVAFEKDIAGLTREAQAEEIKNFIDTIPFESVLTRTYPIEKGVKVIGFNEDLYTELKNGFEKNSFGIDMVIPYQLLGTDQTLIKNLTTDNAAQFLKRCDHLKQYTLLITEKQKNPGPSPVTETVVQKPKKNYTRLFVMIGVFTFLFAVLGYMLITMK
ncbi:MAG: hypothetical protein Q7T54_05535 [Candidatus Levybacteria bacterium]|nr:hypothetical protein [Candidatus Levybacteria bacterium]